MIAEANLDLVHLYRHLQHDGAHFISACESLFTVENNQAERYYQLRDEFNCCQDSEQRATLFLYLNRHGYNGLCRYNQSAIYNVPFGSYKKPYFPKEELQNFVTKSQQADICYADFRDTFAAAEPGDVIYCDPPYAPIEQSSNFSAYTSQKFGTEEQIALAELALQSTLRGITTVISNHDNAFTRDQYSSAAIHSFMVRRSISRNSRQRLCVKELLAVFKPVN